MKSIYTNFQDVFFFFGHRKKLYEGENSLHTFLSQEMTVSLDTDSELNLDTGSNEVEKKF